MILVAEVTLGNSSFPERTLTRGVEEEADFFEDLERRFLATSGDLDSRFLGRGVSSPSFTREDFPIS